MRSAGVSTVTISTPTVELPGRRLTMWLSDIEDEVRLRIEQIDYVRLADGVLNPATDPAAPSPAVDSGEPVGRLPARFEVVPGALRMAGRRTVRSR